MAALFLFLSTISSKPSIFTRDVDCGSWPHLTAWKRAGYDPVCIGDTEVHEVVHRHCKHRPRKLIQYGDIARLLILYENGGWFVDSDVRPTALSRKVRRLRNTTFGLQSTNERSLLLWTIYGVRGDERLKDMACTLAHLSTEPPPAGESYESYIHRTSGHLIHTRLWRDEPMPVEVFGCGQPNSLSPPCKAHSCWGCHQIRGRWHIQ